MAWGIYQVENIGFAIIRLVVEAHVMSFDGDAALTLEVHGIENLLGHFASLESTRSLEQAIRKRRLAMIDVCDY